MGYFSNNSENDNYAARWCDRCVHRDGPDDKGCPVMNLHYLHNGNGNAEQFLDALIPQSEDGLRNLECTMFHAAEGT